MSSDEKLAEIEAVQDRLETEIAKTPSGDLRNLLTEANIVIGTMKNDLWDPVVPE